MEESREDRLKRLYQEDLDEYYEFLRRLLINKDRMPKDQGDKK